MSEDDPPDEYRGWVTQCLHRGEKSLPPYMRHPNVGDCSICEPDEKNINCGLYYPVRVYRFFVYDEEEDV